MSILFPRYVLNGVEWTCAKAANLVDAPTVARSKQPPGAPNPGPKLPLPSPQPDLRTIILQTAIARRKG